MDTDQTLAERFEADGYVVVKGLISPAMIDELAGIVQRLAAEESDPTVKPRQVQIAYGKNRALRMVKISQLTRTNPAFSQLAHRPAVVDVVEQLIGPGARLFRDVVVVKPARTGAVLSMHQDSAYWDVDPPRLVSAWIALTNAPVEASCLEVLVGSHRSLMRHGLILRGRHKVPYAVSSGLRRLVSLAGTGDNPGAAGGNPALWKLKRLVLAKATSVMPVLGDLQDFRVLPGETDRYDTVTLPVQAGDAVFFHSLLAHGTGTNTTAGPRYAAIVSYMPAGARATGRGATDFPLARQSA